MPQPTLTLTPRKSALLVGHDNRLDLLVRVQGPELPPGTTCERPPLSVALVLDRSGSMSGPPLEEAARCARFVLDGLRPTDRAALVTYDDRVDLLVPPSPLGRRSEFDRALRGLSSGGATDLHGGWRCGADALRAEASAETLSRVILLSDGCANRGVVEPQAIATECRELAERGVTTSTYGLAHRFNEDLMVEMARAGQGNSYYGETAEDLMDPFREELELLNALFARGLELEVEPAEGVRVELLNDYATLGSGRWRLPDLAYASEAWAMLRVHVPRDLADAGLDREPSPLVGVRVRYRDLGGMHLSTEASRIGLPAVPLEAFSSIAEDPAVQRRASELEAARLQLSARRSALEGDWRSVDEILSEIQRLGVDNVWIRNVERELKLLARRRDRAQFSKEARYASRKMRSRLASLEDSAEDLELNGPAFLRRKPAQGKRPEARR